jgi:membrane fusion protein (multidrug efflux system)
MIGGPAIILLVVAYFILTGGKTQNTDDAYVDVGKAPISAAIAGRVVEVDVADNQAVKAGQILFRLDPADQIAAAHRGEAMLAEARLQVTSLQHALAQQKVNLAAVQVTEAYAEREARRQSDLVIAGVASARQAADAKHAADVAKAQVAAAREQVATAVANLAGAQGKPEAYPAVAQAQAALETMNIALSRTVVRAPADGIVTQVDQLQPGAYVNPSQTVFFLLSGEPWIDANFKENQLAKMRVGQPATIVMDALGGQKFKGHVESFSPGSGSSFSPLPAQNATGNWVKVVQRLPVRIAFDKAPPGIAARAGLSANVTVDVVAPGRRPAAP